MDPTNLKETAPRIVYEIKMLRDTSFSLRTSSLVRSNTLLRRVFLESTLLHARSLLEFFTKQRCDKGVSKYDVLAQDYSNGWLPAQPPEYLLENRQRLNRMLAHLSYKRNQLIRTNRRWDIPKISAEIEGLWSDFYSHLSLEKAEWFVDNDLNQKFIFTESDLDPLGASEGSDFPSTS